MHWNKLKTEKLKGLFNDGLSRNEIAREMRMTYHQINSRLAILATKRNTGRKKVVIDKIAEQIISIIRDTKIKKLSKIPIPHVQCGRGDEEVVVLDLSDWQLGHKTISFNIDIATKRVRNLIQAVFKIVAIHRNSYPIKSLRIILGGDFIQSEDTQWKVDLSELEMIMIDQIFKAAVPLLSWLIGEMACIFEDIEVYTCRGNHGRGPKGSSEKTNFDDIIYHIVAQRFENNPRIKFFIAKEFYQVFKVKNTSFLIVHGDQMKSLSYGIPFYALLQRMMRWAGSIPEHWDVMVSHHWHTIAYLEQNDKKLFVNGTLVSDDEYVRRNLGWNSSTKQWLFSVHPKRGITWKYDLDLIN